MRGKLKVKQAGSPKPKIDEDRKERYLAMLSHDLRSAISNVIAGLELMTDEHVSPDNMLHKSGALDSARQVSALIDGILDIRAIDDNDFYLDIEPVDVELFLQELYRTWLGAVSAKHISFKIEREGPFPSSVQMDRGRVLRVVGNLLDNAIKYTDVGEVILSVGLSEDQTLRFCVKDSGPGFSDAALKQLYAFYGRPKDSTKPGTGLGLHIAKSLLDNMGGEISVQNHTGDGASVTILVPLAGIAMSAARGDQDTASQGVVSVLPNTTLPDLSHLHILLAEDNMTNQMVVTQMLDAMGATFEVASDGVEAIELFDRSQFNLALLDIEMPRKSGLDVIRYIRRDSRGFKNIPVIALTAYAMQEHRKKIANSGADGIISKPILGIEVFGHAILENHNRAAGQHASTIASVAAWETPIIDAPTFEALEKSIGADKMSELLSKVTADLDSVAARISTAKETNNLDEIASASHILISVAGAIGASSTQNAGQLLNRAAHMNDAPQIAQQITACLTGIQEISNFLKNRSNN